MFEADLEVLIDDNALPLEKLQGVSDDALDLAARRVVNVAPPRDATDAATKEYVDRVRAAIARATEQYLESARRVIDAATRHYIDEAREFVRRAVRRVEARPAPGPVIASTVEGPAGPAGANGADGAPGPNIVSTMTETTLTGFLYGDGSFVGAVTAVARTDQSNTFTAAQTITTQLTLTVPSGGVPVLFFEHDRVSGEPSIRWRSTGSSVGLRFYSVSAGGVATEIGRFQDNGRLQAGAFQTLAGNEYGDSGYVSGGSNHRFRLGSIGSDSHRLDSFNQTSQHTLCAMKSSTTNSREALLLATTWTDSTDASRKARTVFSTFDTAAREFLRGEASGTAPMIGFLGASAVARPTVSGSRGGNAALASLLTALANLGLVTDSSS